MGKSKNKEHKKTAAKTGIRQRHASDSAVQTTALTELAVLPAAGTPPLELAYRPEQIASDEREVEMYSEMGSPPEHIDDPEKQAIGSEKQWWQTKTIFGGLSQFSVAASFLVSPLYAIVGAIANNSAVGFTIMYFFRKNKEIRKDNEKTKGKIRKLRDHMQEDLNIEHIAVPRTVEPRDFGISPRDSSMYLLVSALFLDVVNLGLGVRSLLLINPFCAFDESLDLNSSDISSGLFCELENADYPTVYKWLLSATGFLAIGLAFPQMLIAHNLRGYHDKLNKEFEQLQQLVLTELSKQISSLTRENKSLSAENQKAQELIVKYQQIIKDIISDISQLEDSNVKSIRRIIKVSRRAVRVVEHDIGVEDALRTKREIAHDRVVKYAAQRIADLELAVEQQKQEVVELRKKIEEQEMAHAQKGIQESAEPVPKRESQTALIGIEWHKRSVSTQTGDGTPSYQPTFNQ